MCSHTCHRCRCHRSSRQCIDQYWYQCQCRYQSFDKITACGVAKYSNTMKYKAKVREEFWKNLPALVELATNRSCCLQPNLHDYFNQNSNWRQSGSGDGWGSTNWVATRHSGVVVPSSGWLRNDSNRNFFTNFTHRNISIWMQACSLSRSAFSLGRCCKGWGKYKGFLYFFSWSSEQVGLTRITKQTSLNQQVD